MNETNKLINEKNTSSNIKNKFQKKNININNEKYIIMDFPIEKIIVYRVKLGFFFMILIHLIFGVIDYYVFEYDNKNMCMEKDPIWMFDERLDVEREIICRSRNSTHACYKNTFGNYQSDKGVICKMKNVTLDPSKWHNSSYYQGPIDYQSKGFPLISKGFFNMMCSQIDYKINDVNYIYDFYFNSWNYTLNNTLNLAREPKYEELAPEKTVFFITRNPDTTNWFTGVTGFLNAYALMKSFYINPEDIQIVFIESEEIKDDPFYDLYKELISRGADPVHISNLTKKYHIRNGIHIPLNWDSPCFIFTTEIPICRKTTKTYDLLNKDIKEYLELKKFFDSIGYNKTIFYYPKTIINPTSKIYKKYVTIQWRKVWPKGRTGQQRIMGNGPELAEALAEKMPKDVLLRLVDTSQLPIKEQIKIMKKTDFFIGEHGDGLFLSIFLPSKAIVQEISHKENNINVLQLMSSLSGHVTYSDIIKARIEMIDGNEVLFFDTKNFVKVILTHMKKNDFIKLN